MPRGARLDVPGTHNHVMILSTSIYAFALMTIHAHILLKSGPMGLSTFMRLLLSG